MGDNSDSLIVVTSSVCALVKQQMAAVTSRVWKSTANCGLETWKLLFGKTRHQMCETVFTHLIMSLVRLILNHSLQQLSCQTTKVSAAVQCPTQYKQFVTNKNYNNTISFWSFILFRGWQGYWCRIQWGLQGPLPSHSNSKKRVLAMNSPVWENKTVSLLALWLNIEHAKNLYSWLLSGLPDIFCGKVTSKNFEEASYDGEYIFWCFNRVSSAT